MVQPWSAMYIEHLHTTLLVVVRQEGVACGRCTEHDPPGVDVCNTGLHKRRSNKTLGLGRNSDLESQTKRKFHIDTGGLYKIPRVHLFFLHIQDLHQQHLECQPSKSRGSLGEGSIRR